MKKKRRGLFSFHNTSVDTIANLGREVVTAVTDAISAIFSSTILEQNQAVQGGVHESLQDIAREAGSIGYELTPEDWARITAGTERAGRVTSKNMLELKKRKGLLTTAAYENGNWVANSAPWYVDSEKEAREREIMYQRHKSVAK